MTAARRVTLTAAQLELLPSDLSVEELRLVLGTPEREVDEEVIARAAALAHLYPKAFEALSPKERERYARLVESTRERRARQQLRLPIAAPSRRKAFQPTVSAQDGDRQKAKGARQGALQVPAPTKEARKTDAKRN